MRTPPTRRQSTPLTAALLLVALLAGTSGPVRAAPDPAVAAAGDVACDPKSPAFRGGRGTANACRQGAVSELLLSLGPDALLTLGDAQYTNGRGWKFRRSYHPSWGRLLAATRPALGNHDYGTPRAADYFDYFGDRAGRRGRGWHLTRLGGWRLLALNSNCWAVGCARGSAQHNWLARQLRRAGDACVLAFMHHPRFSSGPHGDQRLVLPLWRLLYRFGADVVLAAHDHVYERFARMDPRGRIDRERGIRSFVVGTGGAQLYRFDGRRAGSQARSARAFGVLVLELGPADYDWRFVTEDGRVPDSGRGRCH